MVRNALFCFFWWQQQLYLSQELLSHTRQREMTKSSASTSCNNKKKRRLLKLQPKKTLTLPSKSWHMRKLKLEQSLWSLKSPLIQLCSFRITWWKVVSWPSLSFASSFSSLARDTTKLLQLCGILSHFHWSVSNSPMSAWMMDGSMSQWSKYFALFLSHWLFVW